MVTAAVRGKIGNRGNLKPGEIGYKNSVGKAEDRVRQKQAGGLALTCKSIKGIHFLLRKLPSVTDRQNRRYLVPRPAATQANENQLSKNYEILVTMGGVYMLRGFVISTLNKLSHRKPDFVRTDDNWKNWQMEDLVNHLQEWLKRNRTEEQPGTIPTGLQDFLAQQEISWQFNLSKSPWWGEMHERLINEIKKTVYKTLRK